MFIWLNKRDRDSLRILLEVEQYGVEMWRGSDVDGRMHLCDFINWAYPVIKKLKDTEKT
uniref:Uncharacterized protein n=1 Tax=viral metagenome TaxID=1070528 RepID=A0A6H1ZHX1_9ZZZZ